jgi:hypothetical protein
MDITNIYELVRDPGPTTVGTLFAFMGFVLIYKNQSRNNDEKRNLNPGTETLLSITREGPGIVFALFGATLIIIQYQAALVIFVELSAIVAGLGFAFMGYLLFDKGLFNASDVEAVWGDKKLFLKRAAPGTLFALFGAFVIVFALYKVPSLEHITNVRSAKINYFTMFSKFHESSLLLLGLTEDELDGKNVALGNMGHRSQRQIMSIQ